MSRTGGTTFLALLGVVFGIYFLGIATALAVVWFGGQTDYRLALTLSSAALSGLLLAGGALGLYADTPGKPRAPKLEASVPGAAPDPIGGPAKPDPTPVRPNPAPPTKAELAAAGISPPPIQPPESQVEPALPGTTAPTATVGPAPEPKLRPEDLIQAWEEYQRDGDGHFNERGLQDVLAEREIPAQVLNGDRIDLAGSALIVQGTTSQTRFFVLPSFGRPPRAVQAWFDDRGSGGLTARTGRLMRVAEGRWTGEDGYTLVERGEVA